MDRNTREWHMFVAAVVAVAAVAVADVAVWKDVAVAVVAIKAGFVLGFVSGIPLLKIRAFAIVVLIAFLVGVLALLYARVNLLCFSCCYLSNIG